ncbi:MAG TPA: hypothetical protein VH395_06955 [Jatrophihabitantaceae bacterium]
MTNNPTKLGRRSTKLAVAAGALALGAAGVTAAANAAAPTAAAKTHATTFKMVRSAGAAAAKCIPHAGATVTVRNAGQVEIMNVYAHGLPKNTEFDLFVLQVPNAPFGVSWYQGDLETNKYGNGHGRYVGRFSVETFAIAPGVAPAPSVHSTPIPDATSNPAFGPVHTYHLGLWFNSSADAAKAGCPSTVTPFNGEHNAGIQALSTRQFQDQHGPLRRINP